MRGFVMNLETAEEFFKRCEERKATTEAERLIIMNELVHEKNIKILKDKATIAKTIQGKNVLHIRSKKDEA